MQPRFACAVTLAFVLSYGSVRAATQSAAVARSSGDLERRDADAAAAAAGVQGPGDVHAGASRRVPANGCGSHPQPAADARRSADASRRGRHVRRNRGDQARSPAHLAHRRSAERPAAAAAARRAGARGRQAQTDPTTIPKRVNLAERCLLGNFGLGGSTASPPMSPSPVLAPYYQIVQTDTAVMIFTEWMHDTRIIRMNATHLPPAIQRWLGDSVGHWEGDTLVVDTTNFRPDTHQLDSSERLHVVERFTRIDRANAALSRDRRRSRHVGDRVDGGMAVHGHRCAAVRRGLPRRELRDREFPEGARAEERAQQPVR